MLVEKVLKQINKNQNYVLINDKIISNDQLLDKELDKIIRAPKDQNINIFFEFKNYDKHEEILTELLSYISEFNNSKLNFYCLYNETEPIFSFKNQASLKRINNKIGKLFNTEILTPFESIDLSDENNKQVVGFYSFKEVLKANGLINDVANEIMQLNFSNYEKYLAAYAFVTNFVYTKPEDNENEYLSRTSINAINYNKLVCPAYVYLLKALCNKLEIPICEVGEQGFKIRHIKAIVKIIDPKYSINGIYISNPTMDSRIDPENKSYFAHLLPLKVKISDAVVENLTTAKVLFRGLNKTDQQLNTIVKHELQLNGFKYYDQLKEKGFLTNNYKNLTELSKKLEERNANMLEFYKKDDNLEALKRELNHSKEKLLKTQKKTNYLEIIKLHNLVNNTPSPSLENFASALYNVYSNINLDYFDNPNPTHKEVEKLVNYTISYSYYL